MAIAAGAISGLGLGENARAAMITRGLAEMTRLCVAQGGHMSSRCWAWPGSATW